MTPSPGTQHRVSLAPLGLAPGAFVIVSVAAGLILRTWQYSADVSLWLDEIAVARNVLERPLVRLLFEPLDYDQTAPKGFLLAEFVVYFLSPAGAMMAAPVGATGATIDPGHRSCSFRRASPAEAWTHSRAVSMTWPPTGVSARFGSLVRRYCARCKPRNSSRP